MQNPPRPPPPSIIPPGPPQLKSPPPPYPPQPPQPPQVTQTIIKSEPAIRNIEENGLLDNLDDSKSNILIAFATHRHVALQLLQNWRRSIQPNCDTREKHWTRSS